MKKVLAFASLWSLPLFAFAVNDFDGIIGLVGHYLSLLVPLFIAAAVVMFLYGVLTYVISGGDEEKRQAGRDTIIYGIIAIFVMVSVWGLVGLLKNSLGLSNGALQGPVINVPNVRR